MVGLVCVLNAVVVLPFAVSVLAAPDFTFANFGIELGPEGAGVARGYGATALGWGIACALLRDATGAVARSLLIASLAFNLAEVLVQLPIALSGIALPMIWGTVLAHGVLTFLSALGLMRVSAPA